jgi:hypothetical protein
METADENRGTPVVADVRRQSDQGVLRNSMQNVTGQKDTKRRKTLSGALPKSNSVEESESQFPQPEEVVISPPRKTPSKHRISLGAAHAYYFKSTSKTPFQKDTSFQGLNESNDHNTGDVTANVAELSFLSLAGSTGSSSSANDTLNQSVLSDTTELTASNFILASSSRQRLAEFSKLAAERKQHNEKNETVELKENEPSGGTSVPPLPADANIADSSDAVVKEVKAPNSEPVQKEVVGITGSASDARKETIDVRRFSMGTASAPRHVPSPVVVGRKSWHGTPGSVDVNSSVQKYKELAASMKQVRLARDQQRQEEIKTRLSISNMSRMTDRSELMSNTSFLSTPSESSSSGSRDDATIDLSRKVDVSDLGSRTLDDLFEGIVPASASRSFSTATREAILAPATRAADHNEHGVSDVSGSAAQSVFNASSQPASAQKALTPTKLLTSPRRIANPMSSDSPARNTRSASKNDMNVSSSSQVFMDNTTATDEVASTSALSPFKSASAQKVLTPTKLSVSPRRIANLLSIDSPARNTRSASKSDMNASALRQTSVDSSTASSEGVEANVMSPFKPASTQKVLTPTKLSASPRRIANPMSIDSPARNTRSASKSDMNTSRMSQSSMDSTPSSEGEESSVFSPFNKPALTQKVLTPTGLSTSPRRIANPMSTDSPARNTCRASKSDMNANALSQASVDSSTASSEGTEASATSPFKSGSAQKVLTPTKLSASPRRIANPMSLDSPARNTRSASKKDMNTSSLSQVLMFNTTAADEVALPGASSPSKSASAQKTLTPTKLSASPRRIANPMSTDSPARNTRSAAKTLSKSPLKADSYPEPFIQDESHGLDDVTPARNNRTNALTEELHVSIGSKRHQAAVLHSSLRKHGSARKRGDAVRHVEFGSPEFVEFNKSSPSMNLTPMPAKKLRVAEALPEDTVEIEADMNALLNGVPPQSGFYMSSPSIGLKVDSAKNAQESACDMSIESLSESREQETVQLEMNMDELLHDRYLQRDDLDDDNAHDATSVSGKESKHGNTENSHDTNASGMDESDVSRHNTVSLEANMSDLLKFQGFIDGEAPPHEKSHDRSHSPDHGVSVEIEEDSRMQLEEENTVELEMNMSALLMATDFDLEASMNASPKTARNRRRRSSISSRRFSLVPESRLSLSTDGQIIDAEVDEKMAFSVAEQEESTPTSIEMPLTWTDVFSALNFDVEKTPCSSDFLKEVTGLLRDVEYGVTLNAVYSQVVDHIEETTDPPLDDQMKLVSDDLQRALNSGKKHKYEMLVQSVQANELKRWTNWLISVADTLAVPLKDLYAELLQKVHVIDKNSSWIEESLLLLSSLEQRAALRARKRSFFERKVSKTL